MEKRKTDITDRLINFASDCIDVSEKLPKTFAGNHIASQLVRSATSPALYYGEAIGAETPADFAQKMRMCLKELRETFNCLKLIRKKSWYKEETLARFVQENNELIAIFASSLKTVRKKLA